MRTCVTLCGFVMICVGWSLQDHPVLLAEPSAETSPSARKPPAVAETSRRDVTAEVRKHNSSQYASPPTSFRKGHVKPLKLDAKAFKSTKTGFQVSMPSKAPIPTPAIYRGKLYVSGGFHSKEYFCLDASTGKLVWGVTLDDDGPSTAACEDGVVVFNTESCTIFALDALTGVQKWSYWLGDPLTSSPTIANGRVFASYPVAGGGAGGAIQQQLNLPNLNIPANGNPFPGEPPPLPNAPDLPLQQPANPPQQEATSSGQSEPDNPFDSPANVDPEAAETMGNPFGEPSEANAAGQVGHLPPDNPAAQNTQADNGDEIAPRPRPQPQAGKPRPPCSHVLACFDLQTGKILWQRWIDSDVMSAPVATGKDVYVTSFAGTVYKFEQKSGRVQSASRSRATSAPLVVGNDVYITQRNGRGPAREWNGKLAGDNLNATKPYAENAKRAEYIDAAVQSSSVLATQGQQLDAGNGFGAGAPLAANPSAALENIGQGNVSTMQAFQGSRFTRLGNANFNCPGDEVVCVDPESGKKLWSHKLPGNLKQQGGFLAAPPVAAGGRILVAALTGEVLQFHAETGRLEQTYRVGHPVRSQPIVYQGRIYVGTANGQLVCIDTKNQKLTGWPMWGANAARTGVVADNPKANSP